MAAVTSSYYAPSASSVPFSLTPETTASYSTIVSASLISSKPGAMTAFEVAQEVKIIFEALQSGVYGTPYNPQVFKRKIYNKGCSEEHDLPRSFLLYNDPLRGHAPCAVVLLNRQKISGKSADPLAFDETYSKVKKFKEGRLIYPLHLGKAEKVIVVVQNKNEESTRETEILIRFRTSPFIIHLKASCTLKNMSMISEAGAGAPTREKDIRIFDLYPEEDLVRRLNHHINKKYALSLQLGTTCLDVLSQSELTGELIRNAQSCLQFSFSSLTYAARALVEMHKSGYAHRDIKAENIFGKSESEWLLGDLGFAIPTTEIETDDYCRICGTMEYTSPEKAHWFLKPYEERKTTRIDHQAADIWALGAAALMVLTQKDLPWHAQDEKYPSRQVIHITRITQEYINAYVERYFGSDTTRSLCKEALLAMLTVDPAKRVTAEGANILLSSLCAKYAGEDIVHAIPLPFERPEFLAIDDEDL